MDKPRPENKERVLTPEERAERQRNINFMYLKAMENPAFGLKPVFDDPEQQARQEAYEATMKAFNKAWRRSINKRRRGKIMKIAIAFCFGILCGAAGLLAYFLNYFSP